MPYDIHKTHDTSIRKHFGLLDGIDPKLMYYIVVPHIFVVLVAVFEIPLVYRVTGSLEGVNWARFMYYTWIMFGYMLFYAFRLKVKVSTLFKTSLLFQALTALYLMVAFKHLGSLTALIPMFAIRGCSVALFAIAYHTSLLVGLKDSKRDSFILTFRSLYGLLPIFLPILGGFIIKYLDFSWFPSNNVLPDGYFTLFLLGGVMSVLGIIFSPKTDIKEDFSDGLVVPIKYLFKKELKYIRNFIVFRGYVNTLKIIVYGLLGFIILNHEANLGIFSSAIALIGSVYFLFIRNFEKSKHVERIKFFIFGIVGDTIAQIIYFLDISFIGLLVKSVSETFLGPLKGIFGENIVRHRYDVLTEQGNLKKSDLIMFQEMALYVARVLSFVTLAVFLKLYPQDILSVLKYLILAVAILDLFKYPLLKKIK
jgi:hypothetical protein